jgi:TonB family protein
MDAFGDDAVRAPLAAFRAAGAPLSAVTLSGLPWPFVDAAALTGGQAIAAPLDAEGLAVLLRALGPRPTRPAVALRGVDDWRPLETIAGQPVWIGRALGAAAAPDAGAAVPVEGDAGDLLALWDRDRLVWFDGGRGRTERTPPAALTPLRALLVLESEQDYVRHGLAVPEPIADTARGDGHYGQDSALAPPAVIGDDASDVLGHLVGNQIADAYGVGGLGIVGTGSGGGGPGLDLHTIGKSGGEGNGSGYGRSAGGLGGRRASAPEVIPGQATVRGALDREIIRRIVRRHINEVRFCYDQALKANPFLGGSVVVQFTIAASGTVIASTLQSSTLGDRAVESCLVADVKRWEFPRPYGGGIVIASYPFEFVPGASGEPSAATLGDPAVTEALAILAGSGPLAGRVARVAARLDLPETADAESLAWTIDRSQAKLDLLVLVARLLVAAARTHDAVRVLSERAAVSPRPIAAELRRIGQEGDARDVLARGGRGR